MVESIRFPSPIELFSGRRCIGISGKLLCLCEPQKIMQPIHGIIPYMFDCWADPVFHLLLLKSSMPHPIVRTRW